MQQAKRQGLTFTTLALVGAIGFFIATIVAATMHQIAIRGDVYELTRGQSVRVEPIVTGLAVGLVLGITQWLMLRRTSLNSRHWILATVLGTMAAWAAFEWLVIPLSNALNVEFGGAAFNLVLALLWGTILGGAQWFVLRRTTPGASLWWLVTAISLVLAVGISQAFGSPLLGFALAAILQGILIALAFLLLQNRQPQPASIS